MGLQAKVKDLHSVGCLGLLRFAWNRLFSKKVFDITRISGNASDRDYQKLLNNYARGVVIDRNADYCYGRSKCNTGPLVVSNGAYHYDGVGPQKDTSEPFIVSFATRRGWAVGCYYLGGKRGWPSYFFTKDAPSGEPLSQKVLVDAYANDGVDAVGFRQFALGQGFAVRMKTVSLPRGLRPLDCSELS